MDNSEEKRIKILHINRNYLGTTLHQLMVMKLQEAQVNGDVFVPTHYGSKGAIVPNSNVYVSECFRKIDSVFFYHKQRKIYKALKRTIDIRKYDCIHAYTLFTDGNCARKISKEYEIPYVVAIRNTDVNDFFPKQPHLRKLGVQIMIDASAVFFLSEAYRDYVLEKYVPQEYKDFILSKVFVQPNGIDDFWFKNKYEQGINRFKRITDKEEIKLIYAGKIDRNKNISTTQDAVKKLNHLGYRASLTVVGKVIDKNEYNRIKNDCNTLFLEPVAKEKLIDLYRQSDIFVMPSFTETFGLVYAEAMSQGLPIIYSKGQGFDCQFEEGVVGFHVDSNSSDQICDCVLKIIGNYDEISSNAVKCVNRFNWDDIVLKYKEIYAKSMIHV